MSICKKAVLLHGKLRRAKGEHLVSSKKYMKSAKGQFRQKARNAVQAAIKKGLIEKPATCQFELAPTFNGMQWPLGTQFVACTSTDIEAHHYLGYSEENYLSVIWLCPTHHAILEQED